MLELAREVLAGREAWLVGGAVRDALLGRPVLDVDVACADPKAAAREYARGAGGAQPLVVDARDDEVRILRLEAEQLVADGAADEICIEAEPADEVLDCLVH